MLEKYKNINMKFFAVIAITIVLFFAVNVVGNAVFKKYGFDFTEDNIFALSDGTKNIISKIPEPVTLRFFYSKRASNGFPFIKNHAERIRGVLEKYTTISGGKVSLQIIDPESYTDDEDLAVGYGIKGIDLPNSNEKLYLGLAVSNSKDDTRSIAFFHPERQRFVEYEITKAIYDLSQQKRHVIGLLSTIPMESGPMMGIPGFGGGQAWLILEQLKQSFDIVNIDKDVTKIPENVEVLMLVQPKDFSANTLNAIDQFVLGGGKAMVFADPNKEYGTGGTNGERSFSPDFNKILGSWGVEISTNTIIADRKAARPVKEGPEAQGKVDYIAWLNIEKNGLNSEDITTSLLKNINLATAGSIKNLETVGISVTPLIKTSKQSMRINSNIVQGAPDPNKMLSNFVSDNTEYTLAARLEGKAKTAFPERSSEPGHLAESSGNINVVVVADTDILRDENWAQTQDMQGYKLVTPNGDNNSFVTNIADLLSGSNEIIALRGRGATSRPFDVVEKLKRNAEERYLQKEKELKDTLQQTEIQLAELKKQAEAEAGNKLTYQSQQQQQISMFTQQMAKTRKELRSVQHELKSDVDSLGSIMKFLNIILMPLLISMFAIFIFVFKVRERQ